MPDNLPNQKDSEGLINVLQEIGALDEKQAKEIKIESLTSGKTAESLVKEKGLVDEKQLSRAKAQMQGIQYLSLQETAMSPESLALLPKAVAQRYKVIPFNYSRQTNELSLVMADPTDLGAIEFIEKKTKTKVKPFGADPEQVEQAIEERYGGTLSSDITQVLKESPLEKGAPAKEKRAVLPGVVREEASIAKIVSYLLEYAVKMRASDIHIEPQEARTRVRYRIDGILHEKLVLPSRVHEALISRIKILSDMKIDEKRIPQDGRFSFTVGDEEIDLRVSSLPTVFGEKIVMRLLKKASKALTLQELGLRGNALKALENSVLRPHGIILICGPTGSGKTTTLYSLLTKISSVKVNIVTLEDPVEYQIAGVNQVQINPQAGLTFASGLRSLLRQDPNIIMVGEIRDSETAELAIQAALTGHLVFSTLHTNDAAGALPRLLDMGAEPFLLASSMTAIVAQRVARRICDNCKTEYQPPPEAVRDIQNVLGDLLHKKPEEIKLYKGKSCSVCNDTGYSGRIGIFEVISITDKLGKMILERQPATAIEEQAVGEGMITMKQDGFMKALEGVTTIEEILRVAED
jgi:type IV pilus assembly protein PilB